MTTTADDILFEPIVVDPNNNPGLIIDQQMIDAIKIALTGTADIEFFVDSGVSVDTYDIIADIIEADPHVIAYTGNLVPSDSLHIIRPTNALTIKDVFRRLYNSENTFWFCGRNNGNGIQQNNFTNYFAIDNKVPILGLDGANGIINLFEWWTVGLMSNFVGYSEHYAFSSEIDARKYYGVP